MLSERSLIETVLAPLTKSGSGALGLRDDAAFIRPRAGYDLVITQDSLQAGVHFFDNDPLGQVAQKALRVNLSDLFAKGADPKHYLLSLFIPPDMGEAELRAFAEGLRRDQEIYQIELLGGDTVRTPHAFSLTVTMSGEVRQGQMIHRFGAAPGDHIYVSGCIGDAALGLQILNGKITAPSQEHRDFLVSSYHLPQPPMDLGAVLRDFASASMDVSDGLAGDLQLLTQASGVSARVECDAVPLSAAAADLLGAEADLIQLVLSGGDDYQILCTVPGLRAEAFEQASQSAMTKIGVIEAGQGAPRFVDRQGRAIKLQRRSYTHF